MPNFYELGRGGQFSPEAINRRRAEANGEEVVLTNKKDLIAAIIDAEAIKGKNVSQSQVRRWEAMSLSDIQKLAQGLTPVAKKPEVVLEPEGEKTGNSKPMKK